MDNAGALGILAFLGMFMLVFVIIGIVAYVLMALGLYTMAKNRGIENPWLAWIPIANLYILAKLIGTLSIGGWQVPNLEMFLPLATVVVVFTSWIPVLGFLISIANVVLLAFALHKLYKMYRPEQATLWLILTIVGFVTGILAILGPIFLFIMRNDTPVNQGEAA
ncbi:MAG: hypothetical protein N2484_01975 [Clostridia bacterium]|nr:hypothetical protein [Clostridia bacterium]